MMAWMLGTEDLPLNVHVWRVHHCTKVHQINQVIIFSVGTRQFGTKFIKNSWKPWCIFRYICMLCLQNSYSFTLSTSAYSADIDIFHWWKLGTDLSSAKHQRCLTKGNLWLLHCVFAYESLIVFVSQLVHIVQILTFFIDVY